MKGSVYRRGCTCKRKRCICGSKWYFTIDIGVDPKTGKRKQKQKGGFERKEDAEDAANTLYYEIRQGAYVEETDILFKDFAPEWLNIYSESKPLKPGTIRIRNNEMNHLIPYFAHLKLKDITHKRYQEALNDLTEKYAYRTLEGINRTGKMIFKKALEMRLIKNNPTEFAYLKKKQKTIEQLEEEEETINYLEKEELVLFLDTALKKGLDLDYLCFLILSYTGMRVGELVSLKWKDIDFENHTISITKTYYNPNNNAVKYQLVPPKTKKSKRTILVDEEVIAALQNHKEAQKKIKQRLGEDYYDKDFIFAKSKRHPGYPIFIKTVENRMARLLKITRLSSKLTPHSLRHTHTSLLAEAGVGLEEIMDRLGHSDDDTTRNVYLHMTKEMKKEASHKFGKLMRSLR